MATLTRKATNAEIVVLLVALFGCDRSKDEVSLTLRDSAGIRIVEMGEPHFAAAPVCSVSSAPLLEIGARDEDRSVALFGVRGAVRLSSGSIAIANGGMAHVQVYDNDGRTLGLLGRAGSGPGEFNVLTWIGEDGPDTIAAYDAALRRLTWFTKSGLIIRTLTVGAAGRAGTPEAIGIHGGQLIAMSGFDRLFGSGERRDTVMVYAFGNGGELVDSSGPYPGAERVFYRAGGFSLQFAPIFGRTVAVHSENGRTAIGSTDAYVIDVYDKGRLTVRVRADRAEIAPPAAWVTIARETLKDRPRPPGMELATARAIEQIPVRETLPAFGDLRVDSRRRVWVKDYVVDEEPQRWTVHDSIGVPVARVTLPRWLTVLDVDTGHILGLRRDEFDRESVILLRYDETCFDRNVK